MTKCQCSVSMSYCMAPSCLLPSHHLKQMAPPHLGPGAPVQWVALGSCRSTPPQTPYKYYIRSKRGLLRQSTHRGQNCVANGHMAAVGVDLGCCRSRLGVAKYFVQIMREREAICTSAPCRSRFCRLSEWTVHSDSRHIRGRNAWEMGTRPLSG